jgi:phage repressor protein C with HTH and peptisase S24 domain
MIDADALKNARKAAGLTQSDLARKAGVAQQLIGQLERGEVRSTKAIYRIAEILDAAANILDPALPSGSNHYRSVPLVGYVGAGSQVLALDDHHKGAGLEEVEAPPGGATRSTVAVRVRGESMMPAYMDGDLLYYDQKEDGDFTHLIGRECVVALADGRVFVKRIHRGSQPGRWMLVSHNGSPIEDVEITWAARVKWVLKA